MAADKIGGLLIDLSTNVARLQQDMHQAAGIVRRASDQMGTALSFVKGLIGGLTAGLTAGAFALFVKGTANAADELGKLSQKVGVSVESLSALKYAGKLADVSMDSLSTGVKQLNKSIDEGDKAFARMGISLTDANGKAKTTEQVLGEVAEKFAGMEDGAGKTRIAMDLFGKAGADLIPLLNGGAAGLANMAEEARKAGQIITTETARAAEEFNDNLTRLHEQLQGIGKTIANPLIGNLARMTSQMLAAKDATGSWLEALSIGFSSTPVSERIVDLTQKLDRLRAKRKELANAAPQAIDPFGIPTGEGSVAELGDQIAQLERELGTLQKIREQVNAAEATGGGGKGAAPKEGETESQRKARLTAAERAHEKAIRDKMAALRAERQYFADSESAIQDAINAGDKQKEENIKARMKLLREERAYMERSDDAIQDAIEAGDKANKKMADDQKKASKDMIDAIEGFGRQTSKVFAQAIVDGKMSSDTLKDVFRSFFQEMIEQQLYKGFFQPIMGAAGDWFGDAIGGLFGGAKASGGPVDGMKTYLVGENGPEMFTPGASGHITPNHKLGVGGGINVTIVNNIDSRSDMQTIMGMTNMAVGRAKSEIMRSMQRNGSFAKATR
jgi:hypothetical protein